MQQRTRTLGKRQRDGGRERDLIQRRTRATETLVDLLEDVGESSDIPINDEDLRNVDIEHLYASPYEDMPDKQAAVKAARFSDAETAAEWQAATRAGLLKLRRPGFRKPTRLSSAHGAGGGARFQVPFNAEHPSVTLMTQLSRAARTAMDGSTLLLVYNDIQASFIGRRFQSVIEAQQAFLNYVSKERVLNRAHPTEPTQAHFSTYVYESEGLAFTLYLTREAGQPLWEATLVHYLPVMYKPVFLCEL